ncbi:MAG TPA: hypothetical protein VK781_05350 [Solirubrobacteraceae bacterium]|jgi:hypothetical protein|nr:hypothetical protein [Solirubrobacteraceae bacterium]
MIDNALRSQVRFNRSAAARLGIERETTSSPMLTSQRSKCLDGHQVKMIEQG